MERVNILKQTDIFYDLAPAQLEMIASICQDRNVRAGEMVFQENMPGDEMFVIVRGEVEVSAGPQPRRRGDDAEKPWACDHCHPARGADVRRGGAGDQGLRSASVRGAADQYQAAHDPSPKTADAVVKATQNWDTASCGTWAADMAFKIRNDDLAIREQLLLAAPPSDLGCVL